MIGDAGSKVQMGSRWVGGAHGNFVVSLREKLWHMYFFFLVQNIGDKAVHICDSYDDVENSAEVGRQSGVPCSFPNSQSKVNVLYDATF